MGICPKDYEPCCDDVCYGAGCMKSEQRESILTECSQCGDLTPEDEGDPCEECAWDDL